MKIDVNIAAHILEKVPVNFHQQQASAELEEGQLTVNQNLHDNSIQIRHPDGRCAVFTMRALVDAGLEALSEELSETGRSSAGS